MTVYTYAANVDDHSETGIVEFVRTNGTKADFPFGYAMDLTTDEVTRLAPYITLVPGGTPNVPGQGPSIDQVTAFRQPDGSWIPTRSLLVTASSNFRNSLAFTLTAGGTPKFPIPLSSQIVHVDSYGALWGGGLNALVDDSMAGTYQRQVPDFIIQPGVIGRLAFRNATLTEIDDPSDVSLRRFGPVGGYPYAGGVATAVANGTTTLTLTNVKGFFRVGQAVIDTNATVPVGTVVASVTPAPPTTATSITVSNPVPAGTINLFAIGRTVDLTAVAAGGTVGQLRSVPAVAPFGGDENTPGAYAPAPSASIGFRLAELPRDVTGNQDIVVGTGMRFTTTRKGRGTTDNIMHLDSEGTVQIGLGAVNAGSLALLQVRGYAGLTEIQTITATGTPTGGSFTLTFYPMPLPTDGYPTPQTTAAIAWNATAGVVAAALGALAGVGGAGNLTVTGGPLPGAPITIEFGNVAGTSTLQNQNQIRLGRTSSLTGTTPGLTVAKTRDGIPSDGNKPLLLIRRESLTPTADYFDVQDSPGLSALKLNAAKRLLVAVDMSVNGHVIDVSGGKLRGDGQPFVYDSDSRLAGQSDAARRKYSLAAQGLLAETSDSNQVAANRTAVSGTIYATLFNTGLVLNDVVNGIVLGTAVAGTGTAPTLFKVALLDATGKVMVVSSDLHASTNLTTAGKFLYAFDTPYVISLPGAYYGAIIKVGEFTTTPVQFAARTATAVGSRSAYGANSPPVALWVSQTDFPAVNGSVVLNGSSDTLWMAAA